MKQIKYDQVVLSGLELNPFLFMRDTEIHYTYCKVPIYTGNQKMGN